MRKIILLSSMLCVLAAASANAQISVSIGQPIYYTPPIYTTVYWEEYNRYPHPKSRARARNDWSYWAEQHRQQQEHGRNEHHDNGNHGEYNRGNGHGNRR